MDYLFEEFTHKLEQAIETKNEIDSEKIKAFRGCCEIDNEPDFDGIEKHIEIWFKRHPEEAKEFLLYRKETEKNNIKDTGATESNNLRLSGGLPVGLFVLLTTISPNCFGQKELTVEKRRKKLHAFLRRFPVFKTAKKL